jgi:hypothetical protein
MASSNVKIVESDHGVQLQDVEGVRLINERDLLLNVANERSLILCSAMSEERVRRVVEQVDSAWSVGDRVPCTRSTIHSHCVLVRR